MGTLVSSGYSCLAPDCPEEAAGGCHPGSGSVPLTSEAVLFWEEGGPQEGKARTCWGGKSGGSFPGRRKK